MKTLGYNDFRHVRRVYLRSAQEYALNASTGLQRMLDEGWNSERIELFQKQLQHALDQLSQAKALANLQYTVGRNPSGEGNENFDYDRES